MVSEILKWIRNSRFHSIRTTQFATVERKARSYVYEMASYKGQFWLAPKNRNKSSLTIQRPTVITFMRKQRRGLNGQVCQQNSTHSKADGGAPRFHTLTNERGQRGITWWCGPREQWPADGGWWDCGVWIVLVNSNCWSTNARFCHCYVSSGLGPMPVVILPVSLLPVDKSPLVIYPS